MYQAYTICADASQQTHVHGRFIMLGRPWRAVYATHLCPSGEDGLPDRHVILDHFLAPIGCAFSVELAFLLLLNPPNQLIGLVGFIALALEVSRSPQTNTLPA
jgi:hypothetical protein